MRLLASLVLLAGFAAAPALGQAPVSSAGPEAVSVTVYRDPDRGAAQPFNLSWLNGFALITERRSVDLPAGEAVIRFEGVAGGIIPESAIVTGLADGVIEKNRDAWLLSPGSLLDASLGRRVHIRRTSRATGEVRESEALIRSGADGAVVIETEQGIEALRCTGLPETLVYDEVPAGLSARPTLSVRTRSAAAGRATLTLSYLAMGFDWQADYIAELSPDGEHVDLFAWLTLANGDETGFADADTQAVAGRLNREHQGRSAPQAPPIHLQCWPQGTTTSDLKSYFPPPPAPPSMDIMVTGSRAARANLESAAPVTVMSAQQEELGDLKLYRIPEPVSVAARSQKQVALLRHERVPVETVYRFQTRAMFGDHGAVPTVTTRNRREERLGVPLPAGSIAFFEQHRGRRVLVGHGFLADRAVGEDVEIATGESIDVRVRWEELKDEQGTLSRRITVTNAKPYPVRFEARIVEGGKNIVSRTKLKERDGDPLWAVTVPANGSRSLTFRVP